MAYTINTKLRTKSGEDIRPEGVLPAVVYGAGGENISLSLVPSEFIKLYKEAGESSLVDLLVDGKENGKVLIQEVQYEPVKGRVSHVDFRRVDMNKPITARVELRLVGEAPAVKGLGGTLVRSLSEIEIECLPKDLVSHFDVDISVLNTFDDVIKVKDLVLPAGIQILEQSPETVIATAAPALTEEQIKAMEEAAKGADVSKIEVAGKKKEEEEGADEAAKTGEKAEAKK